MTFKMWFVNWVLNISLAMAGVIFIWVVMPVVETKWNPVYSKFKVLSIKNNGAGGSLVEVEYQKFRDCFPQGYAWYQGDFGKYTRQVDVTSTRPVGSPNLPVGKHHVTLDVKITPEEFASGITAETFSRCHPLWVTRSVIFPLVRPSVSLPSQQR